MSRASRRLLSTGKDALWAPSRARVEASQLAAFADRVAARHGDDPLVVGGFAGRTLADYERLQRWSVARPGAFWAEVARETTKIYSEGVPLGRARHRRRLSVADQPADPPLREPGHLPLSQQ